MAHRPNPPGKERLFFKIKGLRKQPEGDTDLAEARESGSPVLCHRHAPEKRHSCLCYNSGSFGVKGRKDNQTMIKPFGTALLALLFISLHAERSSAQYFVAAIGEDPRAWSRSRSDALSEAQAFPEGGQPVVAEAQASLDFESRFAKGRYGFGVTLGFGYNDNLAPINAASDLRTQLRFAYVFPNFQYNLTGLIGESFYRGALYWMIEVGAVFTVKDPEQNNQLVDNAPTYQIGLVPLQLEYKFLSPERAWAPFLFGGAGMSWGEWSDTTEELATPFEFVLQIGGGLEYFFDHGTALNFNYRLWHLSNSNIKSPNIGINAHIFSLGYRF